MKVVILAGGKGTRISEESKSRPKPMVEIAGKPILWHIMKIYSECQYHDFIVCCGYKGRMKYHFSICERMDLIGATNHALDILEKIS